MDIVHVKCDSRLFTDTQIRAWVNAGDKSILPADQIEEDFIAHQFSDIDLDSDLFRVNIRGNKLRIVNVLWAYTEDDVFAHMAFIGFGFLRRNFYRKITGIHYNMTIVFS